MFLQTGGRGFRVAFFAGPMRLAARPYFTATAGSEAPPKVQFDFNSAPAPAKQ